MNTKKIICGIAVLAIAAVAAVNVNLNLKSETKLSDLQLANVEALADDENDSDAPYCHNGGPGATACSISSGITIPVIGGGTTTGCQVSCGTGYYACCSFRCTCVPN
jgi:hypothetical protein